MTSKNHMKNGKSQQEKNQIGMEDIEVVQNLIERCIQDGMNKKEIVDFLSFKFEPRLICTVWDMLKIGNREFFRAYYANHYLKDQILRYTDLLNHHVEQVRSANLQQQNPSVCRDNRSDVPSTSSSAINNLRNGLDSIQNHMVPNSSRSLSNFGASTCHQGSSGFSISHVDDFIKLGCVKYVVHNFPDELIYTQNYLVSDGSHDLSGFDTSNSHMVNGFTAFKEDDSSTLNFKNNNMVNNLPYEHNSNGVNDLSHFDTSNGSLVNAFTAPEDDYYELGSENNAKTKCVAAGLTDNGGLDNLDQLGPERATKAGLYEPSEPPSSGLFETQFQAVAKMFDQNPSIVPIDDHFDCFKFDSLFACPSEAITVFEPKEGNQQPKHMISSPNSILLDSSPEDAVKDRNPELNTISNDLIIDTDSDMTALEWAAWNELAKDFGYVQPEHNSQQIR